MAMKSDQPSPLLLLRTGNGHHAQGLGISTQAAIQIVAELYAIASISLFLLASLPHCFGYYYQVVDALLLERP
jgi:hypothetical protein